MTGAERKIHRSDDSEPLTGSDNALGLVDFSVFPHLERSDMPDTTLANIEKWAAGPSVPAYAIDDETRYRWSTVPSLSSPRGLEAVSPSRGGELIGS
jgi:hypothetical protein